MGTLLGLGFVKLKGLGSKTKQQIKTKIVKISQHADRVLVTHLLIIRQ